MKSGDFLRKILSAPDLRELAHVPVRADRLLKSLIG